LYTRFIGKETKLKYAYDKLGVYAYENDIELKGSTYTVFVDEDGENFIADVFMECMDNE